YAIVDADVTSRAGWQVPDLADAYLQAGVRFLQLRAKSAGARDVLAWTEAIASRLAPGAWLITNDRVDLALVAGTRHVHLGQDDLPVGEARRLLGDEAIIGVSTHTPAQIADACRLPIDYLAVGPVFGTQTKDTGYTAVGLDLVRDARARTESAVPRGHAAMPIVVIGGVTLANAPDAIEAGAAAVAVISDLLLGSTPHAQVRAYLTALGER
ncbi:MAG TPA: thiamine phosphate synthase, partial [Luteitalea sp.]|nr:thiamine phosphate synthase [Luteitalea sp.]